MIWLSWIFFLVKGFPRKISKYSKPQRHANRRNISTILTETFNQKTIPKNKLKFNYWTTIGIKSKRYTKNPQNVKIFVNDVKSNLTVKWQLYTLELFLCFYFFYMFIYHFMPFILFLWHKNSLTVNSKRLYKRLILN